MKFNIYFIHFFDINVIQIYLIYENLLYIIKLLINFSKTKIIIFYNIIVNIPNYFMSINYLNEQKNKIKNKTNLLNQRDNNI